MDIKNIFENIPSELPEELNETLEQGLYFRLERIVSRGHITPDNEEYNSPYWEWVFVVKGKGEILFIEDNETIVMNPGDYIFIPPNKRHRVAFTEKDTFWLAIYYNKEDEDL